MTDRVEARERERLVSEYEAAKLDAATLPAAEAKVAFAKVLKLGDAMAVALRGIPMRDEEAANLFIGGLASPAPRGDPPNEHFIVSVDGLTEREWNVRCKCDMEFADSDLVRVFNQYAIHVLALRLAAPAPQGDPQNEHEFANVSTSRAECVRCGMSLAEYHAHRDSLKCSGLRLAGPGTEPKCAGPFVDARDCPVHRKDVLGAAPAAAPHQDTP